MRIDSYPTGGGPCPWCGERLGLATCVDGSGAKPKPGDVSVCIRCGGTILFGLGLTLTRGGPKDDADPRVATIKRVVASLMRRPRNNKPH